MQLSFSVFYQENMIYNWEEFKTFLYFIKSLLLIWWIKFTGFTQLVDITYIEWKYFMLDQAFEHEMLLRYERLFSHTNQIAGC